MRVAHFDTVNARALSVCWRSVTTGTFLLHARVSRHNGLFLRERIKSLGPWHDLPVYLQEIAAFNRFPQKGKVNENVSVCNCQQIWISEFKSGKTKTLNFQWIRKCREKRTSNQSHYFLLTRAKGIQNDFDRKIFIMTTLPSAITVIHPKNKGALSQFFFLYSTRREGLWW